jgi:hypothetical protein
MQKVDVPFSMELPLEFFPRKDDETGADVPLEGPADVVAFAATLTDTGELDQVGDPIDPSPIYDRRDDGLACTFVPLPSTAGTTVLVRAHGDADPNPGPDAVRDVLGEILCIVGADDGKATHLAVVPGALRPKRVL